MQGIINVYKEAGMTSFDVIARLRKIFNEKKIGHTGTLDPNATGVLPICIGNATKFVPYITSFNKQYIAIIKLGIQTDTGDITGTVINQRIIPDIKIKDIQKVVNSFIGKIQQKPPMYSAIKINGQKLCNLARKGIEVDRPLREVEIFDISDIKYDKENCVLILKIDCSKGTYIRTLAEDICLKLNTLGTLISLERTKTGSFSKETAHTLSDIANSVNNNEIDNILINIEDLFIDYPKIDLDEEKYFHYVNGLKISNINEDGLYTIYVNKKFIGIGEIYNNLLKRKHVI